MKYEIIKTGSGGNCVVLNDVIAVDMGVAYKNIASYVKDLKIVLLTHCHADHFKPSTVAHLARENKAIKFVCCDWLLFSLLDANVSHEQIEVLEAGRKYNFGFASVCPVLLHHDVPNCGWRIYVGKEKAFYATDTAHLDDVSAKGYDDYFLEANYGEEELMERIQKKLEAEEYCYEIDVPDRHLSREQAEAFLKKNKYKKSRWVVLHEHVEPPVKEETP